MTEHTDTNTEAAQTDDFGTEMQPTDEMDHSELRSEWENIVEQLRHGVPSEEDHARLADRRRALWDEMVDRSDADAPECPECGGTRWTQTIGDPKYCTGCDLGLGMQHEDLIAEVDAYWEAVLAGPQEAEA